MLLPFPLPTDCLLIPTGRTTFVNTLCGKRVLNHKDSDDPTVAHVEDGVKIKPITVGMLICWSRRANPDSAQNSMRKAPASHSQ
jgi:hypothetical protein